MRTFDMMIRGGMIIFAVILAACAFFPVEACLGEIVCIHLSLVAATAAFLLFWVFLFGDHRFFVVLSFLALIVAIGIELKTGSVGIMTSVYSVLTGALCAFLVPHVLQRMVDRIDEA